MINCIFIYLFFFCIGILIEWNYSGTFCGNIHCPCVYSSNPILNWSTYGSLKDTRDTNYIQYWNAFLTTFFSFVVKMSAFLYVVSSIYIGLGTLFYIMHQFFIALRGTAFSLWCNENIWRMSVCFQFIQL